jgi:hypothetical protein
VLSAGESVYLDSSMGHAYVIKGKGPCRLLAVCSASERDLREAVAQSKERAKARGQPGRAPKHATRPARASRRK